MDKQTLGTKIQELLNEKQITRKEFSEKTGLTEAAISRYINGSREPKALTIGVMADALDVSVDELLGTPCENVETLDDAVMLVARSAKQIPADKKKKLINALLDL